MGRKPATNNSSPGKRNGEMKENETTPKKIQKLDVTSPGRNRELSNLTVKIGKGLPIMDRRSTRSGKKLLADSDMPESSHSYRTRSNSDSDKENRLSKKQRTRGKGAEKPGQSIAPKKMVIKIKIPLLTTSLVKDFKASAADESIEESDSSGDEDYEMSDGSPPTTRRPSLARAAAQSDRTPSKIPTTVADPATPCLSFLSEKMSLGTPARATRSRTLFGTADTTEKNEPEVEKPKSKRAQTVNPAATKKKATKKLVVEAPPISSNNQPAADESTEESDCSDDEDFKMYDGSPLKTRRPSLARAAAQSDRTPSKIHRTVADPATPGLSILAGKMTIGTPARATRSRTLFGTTDTTEKNEQELEKPKSKRAQTVNPAATKKKATKKLIIEAPNNQPAKEITLDELRSVLHTSAVPDRLPCRDEEYEKIKKFVLSAVGSKATSQAMYISGVPGTGKTASTKAVIRDMEKKANFIYIYVNAMEFLEPKQIFVHIYKSLTGEDKVISAQNARKKLNFIFQTYDVTRRPVLMLVDELDQLSSRRQEIIYDIFNWTTLEQARVSVIAIANTLDLPERMLSQKISSRLGTNRIIFQPYEFQQIEEIIQSRIQEFSDIVSSDAVQLAARRVAAISGDLRKAIDTLRRSVEIAISKGSTTLALQHVLDAHKEATSVALVLIVCNLSRHEELVFSAAVQQVRSKGVEEFNFAGLYREYRILCTSREGIEPWHEYGVHHLVMKMAVSRLIIASPGKNMMLRKLRLGMLLQEAEMALKERNIREKERAAG